MRTQLLTSAVCLTGLLSVTALAIVAYPTVSYAEEGIRIDDTSKTKQLMPIGQSEVDTKVYSDTRGLSPQPNAQEIQRHENFVGYIHEQPAEIENVSAETVNPPPRAQQKFTFFDKDGNG